MKLAHLLLISVIPGTLVASENNPTKQELLQTIKHIETLATETQQELDAEKQAHAQTQTALDQSLTANKNAQTSFGAYQKQAETEIAKGNAAIASLAHVVKQLHTAKWIMTGIWICLCGFIAIKLQTIPVLGAYSLYGVAGIAVAGVTCIWMFL
jgi:hypothetical protein